MNSVNPGRKPGRWPCWNHSPYRCFWAAHQSQCLPKYSFTGAQLFISGHFVSLPLLSPGEQMYDLTQYVLVENVTWSLPSHFITGSWTVIKQERRCESQWSNCVYFYLKSHVASFIFCLVSQLFPFQLDMCVNSLMCSSVSLLTVS